MTNAKETNATEIKRVKDLIEINAGNKELEYYFKQDIELLKTRPAKYWHMFALDTFEASKAESQARVSLIREMQAYYNNTAQLTLWTR